MLRKSILAKGSLLVLSFGLHFISINTSEAETLYQTNRENPEHGSIFTFLRKIWNPRDFFLGYEQSPKLEKAKSIYTHYLMGVIFENH